MLSLGPDFVLHDQIQVICAEYGADLVRDYEGTSLDALRQMVAMGMGVTFLPQLYVTSEIDPREAAVVALPMARSSFNRTTGLVWRKGSGARLIYDRIADEVVDISRKRFGKLLRFDGGTGASGRADDHPRRQADPDEVAYSRRSAAPAATDTA